jgi:DNA-binding SARP family transcriptional activator/Tfp pilus assembly protein PilF
VNKPLKWGALELGHARKAERLSVAVFGHMSIMLGERAVRIVGRKSRALLGYLALADSSEETRERLVGLLWSESGEEKARASLRQSVREIRETFAGLGFEGLLAAKQSIALDRSLLSIDQVEVLSDAEFGRVHPHLMAIKRLPETLLEGFDNVDPAFGSWLLAKRQTVHDRLLRALESHLRSSRTPRAATDEIAAAVLNLDPTHEEACRQLMRSRAESGDIAGALRLYKVLWDLLDAEYEIEPSPPTQDLVVQIKQGMLLPSAAAKPQIDAELRSAPEPPEQVRHSKRVAPATVASPRFIMSVDAFEVSAISADKTYLVHGFRHELIACLVRFREWYVRDNAQSSAKSAAGALPVLSECRVEASALPMDGAIKLVLTLREAGRDVYIWSDRYQITLANWFDAQQTIVRRIAMALNVHLSAERLAHIAVQPNVTLEIYDQWLRAQSVFLSWARSDRLEAADGLKKIIEAAPNFSPAYSSLAQLQNTEHIVYPGVYRSRVRERLALEAARKAVQLDPLDSRAQLCLAWSLIMAKHYDQAHGPVSLACDLNDSDPWTLVSAALVQAYSAKFDRAEQLARQALDISLSPSPAHWGFQAAIRFLLGDYAGCVEAAALSEDVPKAGAAWAAAALLHLKHEKEAAAEAQRFLTLIRSIWCGPQDPSDAVIMQWLLHIFPIRRREDWERLRDGLRGAGVPANGMDHHGW